MLEDFGKEVPEQVKCCHCKKMFPRTACRIMSIHEYICNCCGDKIRKEIDDLFGEDGVEL